MDTAYREKSVKLDEKIRKHEQRQEENRLKRREVIEKYQKQLEGMEIGEGEGNSVNLSK